MIFSIHLPFVVTLVPFRLAALLLLLLLASSVVTVVDAAFVPSSVARIEVGGTSIRDSHSHCCVYSQHGSCSTSSAQTKLRQQEHEVEFEENGVEDHDTLLLVLEEEIRSMRAREIKQELTRLGAPASNDIFEKEQLVQFLLDVRRRKRRRAETKTTPTSSSSSNGSSRRPEAAGVLETPLFLTTLDKRVPFNGAINGGKEESMTLEPNAHPFATIQIELQERSGQQQTLSLLLDTACSGIVLRPEITSRLNLPKLQTPVTMTGAAGTQGTTGLTQLDSFKLFPGAGEDSSSNNVSLFGPLPAAVQDIGALPKSLDGIIGLSFLSQFASMEIDLGRGSVLFYRGEDKSQADITDKQCVAHGNLSLLPLGIYTVDVMLGKRGPVKMIVDTGAACTLLNWKGVESLGLSRGSSGVIAPIPGNFGGLGADNQAIPLTHRLHVSSSVNLGSGDDESALSSLPGLLLASERLAIDIGNIPILDGLRNHGVGGIIGMDVLMKCSSVKFHLKDRRVELFR